MAFLSLVGPALRQYLLAKVPAISAGNTSGYACGVRVLAVGLILLGAAFGLSGLYEYYAVMYTSLWAKIYMAVTLILLGSVGGCVASFARAIQTSWQDHKHRKALTDLEHYAQRSVERIRKEGEHLFKEHPYASVLIGLALGMLSGNPGAFKRKR